MQATSNNFCFGGIHICLGGTVYDEIVSQVYYLNTFGSTGLLFETGSQYEAFALHSDA